MFRFGAALCRVAARESSGPVWEDFPTENFEPADHVIGQSDFEHFMLDDDNQDGATDGEPSARTLQYPVGGGMYRDKLFVIDLLNNRVLMFELQ